MNLLTIVYVAVAVLLSAQNNPQTMTSSKTIPEYNLASNKMTLGQVQAYVCGSMFESILSSSDTLRTKELTRLYVNRDCHEYSD